MARDELRFSFADDPTTPGTICAACGNTAEIHLSLLKEASRQGASFCLSCGEEVIRDLRSQHIERNSSTRVRTAHQPFFQLESEHEDVEHGIVFWEGQSWSSDGPFAGA